MLGWACTCALVLCSLVATSTTRPDVEIEFINECDFDVNFGWFETACSGATPNMLYLNERVSSGQRTSRVALTAAFAGGRIYTWAAESPSPGAAMTQEVFAEYMAQSDTEVKCGNSYSKYRIGGPEIMLFGAFAELTFTHTDNGIINDADISMVDQFYLPMSWDWLYSNTSDLNVECRNTSLPAMPVEATCIASGGEWQLVPADAYTGAPSGFCKSPNMLCQPSSDPSSHPVCSLYLDDFRKLISQLELVYEDLTADAAFEWAGANRSTFPGQVWTCSQFFNTATFEMAEMCAAINRGLCDLSKLGSMTAREFSSWTASECGWHQNQQNPDTWFIDGFVANPYARWLRQTLSGTTYSFSQDEGPFGGNTNCNNIVPASRAPRSSRVTVCPRQPPSPSPIPTPVPTPVPSPVPSPPPVPSPSPTPAPPTGGKCCWMTCDGDCHVDVFCDSGVSQCTTNCGGTWCALMQVSV